MNDPSPNATAPRVTPDDIEAEIASEHYFTAADGVSGRVGDFALGEHLPTPLQLLTICVLVLRNGFTVTGESACASPANFNAETGRCIAREKALEKLWPLLGFRLRDKIASGQLTELCTDAAQPPECATTTSQQPGPTGYRAEQLCDPMQFLFLPPEVRKKIATVHYFSPAHGLLGYMVDKGNAPAQKIGTMSFDGMPRALERAMLCVLTLIDGTVRIGASRTGPGDLRTAFSVYPEEFARDALAKACAKIEDEQA